MSAAPLILLAVVVIFGVVAIGLVFSLLRR